MSFDLIVTRRKKEFDPEAWEREIAKHLDVFEFDAPTDWSSHLGFLPAKWVDDSGSLIKSGFEFSPDEEDYSFSFASSGDEFTAGWIAAGALAKVMGGSLFDPQEGEAYEGVKALEQALKAVRPKKAAPVLPGEMDFQALSAFQKTNEKEIHKLAKEILQPHRIVREGRSKIWLDDQGWYTGIIEFLPSRHYWGMIINIGANFHWGKSEDMSYDISLYYESPKFKDAGQYAANNRRLVEDALERVLGLRKSLSDLKTIRKTVAGSNTSYEPHKSYHLGIINGLSGDMDAMRRFFDAVLATKEEDGVDWIPELKEEVRELLKRSASPEKLSAFILEQIQVARALKKLPRENVKLPA